MKSNIYIYILCVGLMTACTSDFEEINTNPNSPVEVETEFLFRKVIYDYGEEMSYEGFTAGNLLSQHFAQTDFNLFDRHSLQEPQLGGNPWPILYENLRDNETILNNARSKAADAVYEGPALILKAYMTAALTDIFGDVPYSEAVSGKEGNVTPVYDSQEDIYLAEGGILDNLNKGINAIENYTGAISLNGDLLFEGNLENWIRFANSLKIKALMRISAVTDVSIDLAEVYNSGNYLLDQNASFNFNDGPPNNFRMANLRDGDFNMYVMSETIEQIFDQYNDPRVALFYRSTALDPSSFNGLLNGQDLTNNSITIGEFSLPGTIFRENTSGVQANFMTAWETEFLLAEAALKGYIFANPELLYNSAVTKAFDYWGVSLPSDYLDNGANYNANGTTPLQQIITQKWIANNINGYEAWIEYRRTGFPLLKNLAASLNNDLQPTRMPYPTDEEALNQTNYQQAAANTNDNSINVRVWWDID